MAGNNKFVKIQDISSSNVDFGIRTLISADNSTLIIFSNLKNNEATIDVYQFDSTKNKFIFYASQVISSDGGLDGEIIFAQDGSYFVVGSKQTLNATASVFRINTTNKKLITIYKICEFAITSVTESAAYILMGSPSSEYLTLSDYDSTTEIFVWDEDLINYRSVTQLTDYKNSLPVAIIADDGSLGILIKYIKIKHFIQSDTEELHAFPIKPKNFSGKHGTATDYAISGDKERLEHVGHITYKSAMKPVRNNFSSFIVSTHLNLFIKNNDNDISVHAINYDTNASEASHFAINYNAGISYSKLAEPYVFQLDRKKTNDLTAKFYGKIEDEFELVYTPSASDTGYIARPIFNKSKNLYIVQIYLAENYPNFFIPASYPVLKNKDLAAGTKVETLDKSKFLITITYKN